MLREVGRRGSIAAAADALGYTAPAVSQQLARLEREARVPLLERGPRSVMLTEAGRRLVEHAAGILDALARAEADMRDLAGLVDGTVRLAAFPSAAAAFVPAIVDRLRRTAPTLRLRFEELEPGPALESLRGCEVDIALVYDFADQRLTGFPGLNLVPLRDDPFVLCLPPKPVSAMAAVGEAGDIDPLVAARPGDSVTSVRPDDVTDPVDLADLGQLAWIVDGEPPSDQCFTVRFLRSRGIVPDVVARTNDPLVLLRLVAAGVGAAMLPELQTSLRGTIRVAALEDPPPPRRVLLATRHGSHVAPTLAAALPIVTGVVGDARV
jgi:DNA-binding transcriptional LysR family regulator